MVLRCNGFWNLLIFWQKRLAHITHSTLRPNTPEVEETHGKHMVPLKRQSQVRWIECTSWTGSPFLGGGRFPYFNRFLLVFEFSHLIGGSPPSPSMKSLIYLQSHPHVTLSAKSSQLTRRDHLTIWVQGRSSRPLLSAQECQGVHFLMGEDTKRKFHC